MECDIGPFTFLDAYKTLICRECAFAVLVNEVSTHLLKRHRAITAADRRDLVKKAAELQDAKRSQADLQAFVFPFPTITCVPYLAAPKKDGLKCSKCAYIARQVQKIQEHCKTKYKWENMQRPGRPELKRKMTTQNELGKKHEVPWVEGVSCQRFFPSRNASGWFEVGRKAIYRKNASLHDTGALQIRQSSRQPKHAAATKAALGEHMDAIFNRHQQHLDTQRQSRVYAKKMGNGSFAVISPWLDRTQWRRIYNNVRRDMLKAMARLPVRVSQSRRWATLTLGQGVADGDADFISSQASEERIACVMKAVDLVINRCERTVLHTSRLIRCWIVTSKAMKYNSRSFEVMTERSTRRRYRDTWKKFMAFLIRSHHLSREAKEETGVQIPDDISQLLLQLVQHPIWDMFDAREGQWPPVEDGRYASTDEVSGICSDEVQEPEVRDEGNRNTAQRPDRTLHDSNAVDRGSCSGESSDSSHYESGWESSESIISDEDSASEIEQARTNAGNCQHAINQPNVNNHRDKRRLEMASIDFLELLFKLSVTICKQEVRGGQPGSTVLLYFSGIFGFSSDCQQFKLARDFCPSLSGLIYVQRLLFLESALPLSMYSSLDIPRRPDDGQLEMIQRFCSKYIVAGSASSLAEMFNLRSFGYSAAKTEGPSFILHWSDDDQVVSLGTELTISMDQFRALSGYFISEAEAMAQDLLYGLDPVLNIAEIKDNMTNREVGYSFVKHEENGFQMATRQLLAQLSQPYRHQPPLITHKGWQWSAVKHYLRMVTRLQESIFGGKYTSGGQTPRLRELQWLLCENTAWASRGVYVWNGSVVYIIKHHKAKRMTNKEFYVVRFLPLRLGLVVIKYLAFVHPVAEILRRELHEHMKIKELWQPTHLLFGKNENPWATSKCTSILQAAAHGVWKQRITSQMYRQIAIGITEKHVREVYTPFNQYDEKSPAADKNVAFAMQSGHKVIQRNTTYGLDGAYPHRLQPSLLRAYEWASTKWHAFIHQASRIRKEPEAVGSPTTTSITSTSVEKKAIPNEGKSSLAAT